MCLMMYKSNKMYKCLVLQTFSCENFKNILNFSYMKTDPSRLVLVFMRMIMRIDPKSVC